MDAEDAMLARIDSELYEARRLLARSDVEGARIAAWAALQDAQREGLTPLAEECEDLLRRCVYFEDEHSARARTSPATA